MGGDQIPIVFGQEIKSVRMQLGFTQEGLALAAGVDRSFLSKIERGIRQPSITIVFKLCDALDYPPEKIIAKVATLITV